MAVIKCKMCGGDLQLAENASTAECEYCGSVQTVPKADDEKKLSLFARANRLRTACEFDKAAGIYEAIVSDFPEEAEAYWGLVLCKFGIEYVDDPATGKKVPTCHRSGFESVLKDSDFEQAQENADIVARKVYRDEAKQIEEIRKGIIAVSANEQPYDIFICYKETDEQGNRTLDSVLAQDIYDALTDKGYRVFFSRISLEDKLGLEYEPYIFAALNSAKIMLAIGTDYEYYNAVWVKNEWSRYLKLMAKDKDKHLIPCYKGIDAYDMPEEFARLQAQDLNKMGAVQDILRGVEKLLPRQPETVKETVVKETVVTGGSANVDNLLERVFMFCEDGNWASANEYCEKVLDNDSKNANAYLGKMMAELKVRKQEALKDCTQPFDGNSNYQKALRFGDDKLKAVLTGYIEHIKTRNEKARVERVYNAARQAMAFAGSELDYKKVAGEFESICNYKDAAALAKECYEKAEIARKDAILETAKNAIKTVKTISTYQSAVFYLLQIPGWRDADALLAAYDENIKDLEAKAEAERQERNRILAKKVEMEKRIKKIAVIVIAVVSVIILINIVLKNVIIPTTKYNSAMALMEKEEYSEAIAAFNALGDFKDSENMRIKCSRAILKECQIGDVVYFGTYEQDNNPLSGKELIEWIVLDRQDGKVLLISKFALDVQKYNNTQTDTTWEKCSLRKWLNESFIDTAFAKAEKQLIPKVTVSAEKNPYYKTDPGNDTQDQVFLLSMAEVDAYFRSDGMHLCQATKSASRKEPWEDGDGNCRWWLRTPGDWQKAAATAGVSHQDQSAVSNFSIGVRPAIWVEID